MASRRPYNDAWNFNFAGMIPAAKQDQHDALVVIGHAPWLYVQRVASNALGSLAIPSFAHVCCLFDLKNIRTLDTSYAELPYVLRIVASTASLILYEFLPLIAVVAGLYWLRKGNGRQRRLAQFFLVGCGVVLVMWITGAALNGGGEIERMRWGWAPIYLIQAALLLEIFYSAEKKKAEA
jgi:hypothetical protein